MPRSSPQPVFLMKLYRRYSDPEDQFALGIQVAKPTDRFFTIVGGDDAKPFNDPNQKYNSQPWRYERLEVYADGRVQLTFAIPTVSSVDLDNDFIQHEFSAAGIPERLTLKCHMLLLVGARQADQGNTTTVGFILNLYRSDAYGEGTLTTVLASGGQIGDTKFGTAPGFARPPIKLAQLPDWLSRQGSWQNRPPVYESVDGNGYTPGPLLEQAFSRFSYPKDHDYSQPPKVDIVLLKALSVPTLALVFRSGTDYPQFPLPINPQKVPDDRFSLPVKKEVAPEGPKVPQYRIVQRPSDDWLNRVGSAGEDWLVTFETRGLDDLWNAAVKQYTRSLRTVRPVNRITLLPYIDRINPPAGTEVTAIGEEDFNLCVDFYVQRKTVNPAYDAKVAHLTDLTISPFHIRPLANLQADVHFELGGNQGEKQNGSRSAPRMLSYTAVITPYSNQTGSLPPQDSSLHFEVQLQNQKPTLTPPGASKAPVQIRIGSLDLKVGGAPSTEAESKIQTFQLLLVSDEWNKVPRLVGDMWLPVQDIQPGGQDGLPASEYEPENYNSSSNVSEHCMEQRFAGSAPIVIPVNPVAPAGSFLLKVHEENPSLYSETVSLQLRYVHPTGTSGTSDAGRPNTRVIVIDSDPFLIAAVEYSPIASSIASGTDIVALWNPGALEGQAWQLQTNAKPFDLLLPPQGIGEEMPKAFELHVANGQMSADGPPPTETDSDILSPLDFRFSPLARQRLSASYTPQNYTDAPWNLRRILGYPGQRDAGAGVVGLNYELLYGLSCSVDAPLLRLAEIFSLVGRIPGRIPLLNLSAKNDSVALSAKDQKQDYESKRWQWSLIAELYSKRVAILEPRTSGNNYGNSVGVAGASDPPEEFTLSQGVTCTLRGKADLYYSVDPSRVAQVDDSTFPTPTEPQGLKGGVSWPFESARLFHATVRNPKSSSAISTGLALSPLGGTGTVKAGFDKNLSTITSITEIGRTSKMSVARLGRIGVFHNLARYVIEYARDTSVTLQFNQKQTPFGHRPVLRKIREFVEILEPVAHLSSSTQTYPGGGCIKSIEFKERIIPVTSSWSSNVGSNGWKVPLWYEPDSVANGDGNFVYSRPEIVFNVAGADGSDVECFIQSADKLYFYSETDANADPDPHNWPIVSGVDFLPVPLPSPNPAFPSSNVREIPAYDPPTPFGLASFTHQLAAGHGRINLVNGRSPQPIGATLASVTLQRGPQTVPAVQGQLQKLHDTIRTDLYNAVRQDPSKIVSPAAQICGIANDAAKRLTDQFTALASTAKQKEDLLLKGFLNQAASAIDTFSDDLKAQLHAETTLIQKKLADVQTRITGLINLEITAFSHRLDGIPTSANALQKFFARICVTLSTASADLDKRKAALKAALNGVDVTVSHDATAIQKKLAVLQTTLTGPIDQVKLLIAQVKTQIQGVAEPWMPGATFICQTWEPAIFSVLSKAEAVLSQTETALACANAGLDDQVTTALATLAQTLATAQSAVDSIAFPSSLIAAAGTAQTAANAVSAYVHNLPALAVAAADGWVTTAGKKLQGGIIQGESDLDMIVDSVAQQVLSYFDPTTTTGAFANAASGLSTSIQSNVDAVLQKLPTTANLLTDELCTAATDLQTAATTAILANLETLRRNLEEAAGRLAEAIAQALPVDDIQLPSGISVPALLHRAFGTAPSIQNLGFSLPNAAYFFGQLAPNVNLTPLLTAVRDLVPNLSPLSTLVPTFALSDRALPVPHLPNFDLSNIFPDFAGLRLTDLFPALKMPAGSSDAVKVTHGLDSQSKTAWVQADINLKTDTATIFSLGPMALQIKTPQFTSTVRAQAGSNGQVSKEAKGAITGDWELLIGGSPMITLVATSITFDKDGKIHVNVSPDRVQLSAALSFIEQIIALYSSSASGFGIFPSATGVETRLALPIPDTSFGTTGITNLTFNFLFGLNWTPDFKLYAGFGLASPDAPFNLAIYILGGGGHLVAKADYVPGKSLSCVLDMALDASAALSISLGPISGSVHVNLGMRFVFNSGHGDLSLGIFLLIGGEVSILSIISASILLRLDATYENGSFTCRGLFSITIKICWCFTLHVSEEVSCHLGSAAGMAYAGGPSLFGGGDGPALALEPSMLSTVPPQSEIDLYAGLAEQYMQLIS